MLKKNLYIQYHKTKNKSIEKKYEKMCKDEFRRMPPIIYHYGAKNILCTTEQYFYYKNPRGVIKFRTEYIPYNMIDLKLYFKNNPRISWNS